MLGRILRPLLWIFRKHEICTMDWQALRLDLNPIEPLWDILDRRIRRRPNLLETL